MLAWAETEDGVAGGTRLALYVVPTSEPASGIVRVPWEQIEAADWDRDASVLTVTEVGSWGSPRAEHLLAIAEPGRLLELVRERVTASVVLQRHVAIEGRRGVRVIARRSGDDTRPLSWLFQYDEGIDPTDPFVEQAAQEALLAARDEVGSA